MSKRIDASIDCSSCGRAFPVSLYRSIWGENPENRSLVMSDQINVVTCPACQVSAKVSLPFIYTNAEKFFAVWWEPYPDAAIDHDSEMYAKMMGPESYLASAPRVKDWAEFKRTIERFERGELRGKVGDPGPMLEQMGAFVDHLKRTQEKPKGGGCSGMILASIPVVGFVTYKIFESI